MGIEDIWGELDLDRWTWELPRDTPGPYVAEHIPKPLIADWVKKWKPIINDALEKAEKWDDLQRSITYGPGNLIKIWEGNKKLEAIKTEIYAEGSIMDYWRVENIKEILEG